jgi:ribosomal protein S19E (S16A)
MGGVGVKDVDAQKFINAYAAFLKRQGKLPSMHYPPTAPLQINSAC